MSEAGYIQNNGESQTRSEQIILRNAASDMQWFSSWECPPDVLRRDDLQCCKIPTLNAPVVAHHSPTYATQLCFRAALTLSAASASPPSQSPNPLPPDRIGGESRDPAEAYRHYNCVAIPGWRCSRPRRRPSTDPRTALALGQAGGSGRGGELAKGGGDLLGVLHLLVLL